MTAQLVANASVGQCVPTTASLVATGATELAAKLAGVTEATLRMSVTPPSLAAQVTAFSNIIASLEAQIALAATLGGSLPSIQVDVTAMLAVIADLQASLSALLALQVTLGTAGVYVITHEGASETHGSEMQEIVSDIAPAGNNVHSVTLLCTSPAVFEALGAVILTG